MAPKKGKIQGKRNNVKIKSKISNQKYGIKSLKNLKAGEKPLEDLKWLSKIPGTAAVGQCDAIPKWLNACVYKHQLPSCSSLDNNSLYGNYREKDGEDKSYYSEVSEECDCSFENKGGILKRKSSSTKSLVAKYLKSGMDHVASFIVESAIRFGEQHGVVVPDKNSPNIYNITPPDGRLDEKCRKIRFKIPPQHSRRHHLKTSTLFRRDKRSPPSDSYKRYKSQSSWGSSTDSFEDIYPMLKKLEQDGDIVRSELDLSQFVRSNSTESRSRKRDRTRDQFMSMRKRFKSVGPVPQDSKNRDYSPEEKGRWAMYRKDSLELGRKKLRASTSRKQNSNSPYRY